MKEEDLGSYQPLSYFQLMEVSLRELLVEKGVVTEVQVEQAVDDMRRRTPEGGGRAAMYSGVCRVRVVKRLQ